MKHQQVNFAQSRVYDSEGNELPPVPSQNIISSNPHLTKLLEFQQNFMNLVHRQLYVHPFETQNRQQALLRFQITQIADQNDNLSEMLEELKDQLIEKKIMHDQMLRGYFVKLINADCLPLLRLNRYELTKLAMYGFDIYVIFGQNFIQIDPLQAILEIIMRIENAYKSIEEYLEQKGDNCLKLKGLEQSVWTALNSGWEAYVHRVKYEQISLNLYMLKEYLGIASASLFKKDKELIFTGCTSIIQHLTPILLKNQSVFSQGGKQSQCLLLSLCALNNSLYSFHNSYNYYYFYTLIEPTLENLPLFKYTEEITKKCQNTYILTPLLFGILKNYKAFIKFIDQIADIEYTPFLQNILAGLIINFKVRILEYEEVVELVEKVLIKLGLFGQIDEDIILGEMPTEWKQAKEFFISAFKVGYGGGMGEIQTWRAIDAAKIQLRIRKALIKGLLLKKQCRYSSNSKNSTSFLKGIEKDELKELLEEQYQMLTNTDIQSVDRNFSKLTVGSTQVKSWSHLENNWSSFDIPIAEKQIKNEEDKKSQSTQKKSVQNQEDQAETIMQAQKQQKSWRLNNKAQNLIRIVNLVDLLEIENEKNLYFLYSCLTELYQRTQQKGNQNVLLVKNLKNTGEKLNLLTAKVNRKELISNLKPILVKNHEILTPGSTFQDILPIYLHAFTSKEAISNIFKILAKCSSDDLAEKVPVLCIALVYNYFFQPKSHSKEQSTGSQTIKLKTFENTYEVPEQWFELPSATTACLIALINQLTYETERQRNFSQEKPQDENGVVTDAPPNLSQVVRDILKSMLLSCPQISISLLNMPATISLSDKIESFGLWLVYSPVLTNTSLFLEIVNQPIKYLSNVQGTEQQSFAQYLKDVFYPSVFDQISKCINEIINSTSIKNITETQNQGKKQEIEWENDELSVNKVLKLVKVYIKLGKLLIQGNILHGINSCTEEQKTQVEGQNQTTEQQGGLTNDYLSLCEKLAILIRLIIHKNCTSSSEQTLTFQKKLLKTCSVSYLELLQIVLSLQAPQNSDSDYQHVSSWYSRCFDKFVSSSEHDIIANSAKYSSSSLSYLGALPMLSKKYLISSGQIETDEKQGQNDQTKVKATRQKFQFEKIKSLLHNKWEEESKHNKAEEEAIALKSLLSVFCFPQIKADSQPQTQELINVFNKMSKVFMDPLPSVDLKLVLEIYKELGFVEEESNAAFAILQLNPETSKQMWEYAVYMISKEGQEQDNHKIGYGLISRLILNKTNIQFISKILEHQHQQQLSLQKQGSSLITHPELILNSSVYKTHQKQTLAQSVHIPAQYLPLSPSENIEFIYTYNNTIWREFNQQFSQKLAALKINSTLLQYCEFINIAKKTSTEYEQKLCTFCQQFEAYINLVKKRVQYIAVFLVEKDLPQENQIRRLNEIANFNTLVARVQMEETIQRVNKLRHSYKQNIGNSLGDNSQTIKQQSRPQSFKKIIELLWTLNSLANGLVQGGVVLKTFGYSYKNISKKAYDNRFRLGLWLEKLEDPEIDSEQAYRYEPQEIWFDTVDTLKEFINQSQSDKKVLKNLNDQTEIVKQHYLSLRKQLIEKKLIAEDNGDWEFQNFDETIKTQGFDEWANKFYVFGYLSQFLETIKNAPKIISELLNRNNEHMDLDYLKDFDLQAFHHLKSIETKISGETQEKQSSLQAAQDSSSSSSPNKQPLQEQSSPQIDVYFDFRGEEMMENGKTIKVNEFNKRQFIEAYSERAIGKAKWLLLRKFAEGALYCELQRNM